MGKWLNAALADARDRCPVCGEPNNHTHLGGGSTFTGHTYNFGSGGQQYTANFSFGWGDQPYQFYLPDSCTSNDACDENQFCPFFDRCVAMLVAQRTPGQAAADVKVTRESDGTQIISYTPTNPDSKRGKLARNTLKANEIPIDGVVTIEG